MLYFTIQGQQTLLNLEALEKIVTIKEFFETDAAHIMYFEYDQ
jgi:hypothetical protein